MASSAIPTNATSRPKPDWEAARYLAFERERTRPARDLLAQIPPELSPKRIVDLGCGPGNSTSLLAERYPDAYLAGMDSSPNMLEKARATLPNVTFELGDMADYTPPQLESGLQVDLFYSNAAFQWLRADERVPAFKRLLRQLPERGVFACQVPDNFEEPSHAMMRQVASQARFRDIYAAQGDAGPGNRGWPTVSQLYDALKPVCRSVDIWHTFYQHRLEGHQAIVDWVSTTGLRPFLEPLDEQLKKEFVERYLELLRPHYPLLVDGGVFLRFPRLFMVMVR
jgi:trans-aconitate 2-methyltransferase